MLAHSVEERDKPIDRWLGLGGIAAGIAFYLLPKTPLVVVSSLILLFALLIHPIWNFWWIESKVWRKLLATLLFVLALILLGQISWPPDSGTLVQSARHLTAAFWGWLVGLRGQWIDRSVGAAGAAAAIVIWVLLRKVVHTARLGPKDQSRKGFLDYKLEAETAMSALPALLKKLAALMAEVGPSLDRHTTALQRAGSTNQQLKVSRAASSSLDRYSARVTRVGAKYVEVGESLSEGLSGWSKWIEETHPSKAVLTGFPDAMKQFSGILSGSNDQLRDYIATMLNVKGASRVLDAAIERHVHALEVILLTNVKIHSVCTDTLKIFDSLD